MIQGRDVAAITGKVERRVRLAVLTIAIGQLADEVCLVPALCPSLSKVHTNRAGGPAHLADECVLLARRKLLGEAENPHRKTIGLVVDGQFFGRVDSHDLSLQSLEGLPVLTDRNALV